MNYLFLNSYFNTIEKRIADDVDFDRMINSDNEKKAYDVLQDTNYASWALESSSLEDIFRNEKIFFCKELIRFGFPELVDLFCLRSDITNLRIILKEKLFGLDSGEIVFSMKEKDQLLEEFKKEIKIAETKENPGDLDDYLTEIYLERLKKYTKKEKEIQTFIKDYQKIITEFLGEERDKKIKKLEDDFISENTKKNEGLAPILAFFMKKWKAEKKIKSIICGKQINFSPAKTRELVEDLQAL